MVAYNDMVSRVPTLGSTSEDPEHPLLNLSVGLVLGSSAQHKAVSATAT